MCDQVLINSDTVMFQSAVVTTRVNNTVKARPGMTDVRMNVHVMTLLMAVTAVTISNVHLFSYHSLDKV